MLDERTRNARALFDGIAPAYDAPANLLSFGQYSRWRRALVRALALPRGALVLDVAAGTGLISREIQSRCRVVALDQSEAMLRRAPVRDRCVASADALPFADDSFDAVIFSYLLRYVPDPAASLREIVRALRPGSTLGSVEFGVPRAWWARTGWRAYAHGVFPLLCRVFGRGWRAVGSFLPSSIEQWGRDWPIPRQVDAWNAAGVESVAVRTLTFGAGVVMIGRRLGA